MKVKSNSSYTKIKIFFFILLAASLSGFSQGSQDDPLILTPNEDYRTSITLRPVLGNGMDIEVLAILNWNKENKRIEIEFTGDGNKKYQNHFVYAFPATMVFKKAMKVDKKIWFDKTLKKKADGVYKINTNPADNLDWIKFNDIKTLQMKGSQSNLAYSFKEKPNSRNATCRIPMLLYVASRETKKAQKDRKIDYQTQISFYITLQETVILPNDICDAPELKEQINMLNVEIGIMNHEKETATAKSDELPYTDCPRIKKATPLPQGKEEKIIGINNTQYLQYADCETLKETINKYNKILEERNNAIQKYNTEIKAIKEECAQQERNKQKPREPQQEREQTPPPSCSLVDEANSKLSALNYLLLDCKKADLPTIKQKFENIKETVKDPRLKKCEEYNGFKTWCDNIENLLKCE